MVILFKHFSTCLLGGKRRISMIFIIFLSVAIASSSATTSSEGVRKNNLWIVHIEGGEDVARGVAQDVGLSYKDKGIGHFKDHYVMTREDHPDLEPDDITRTLIDHHNVKWAKQQIIPDQSKYHMSEREEFTDFNDDQEQADLNVFLNKVKDTEAVRNCKSGPFGCIEFSSHMLDYLKHVGQTDIKKLGTFSIEPVYDTTLSSYEGSTKHLSSNPYKLSAYVFKFNDPDWRKQWHMQDYRTSNYPVMDHNIVPVFNMGITGKGVTVGIVGDGVKAHPDLEENYDVDISYDFCDSAKGANPGYNDDEGTSSAGVIAMKSDNSLCGVGIAPDVRISGLKIKGCDYPPPNTEASALQYKYDIIDIYCNIWTIDDDLGKKLIQLSPSVENALKLGTTEGRGNKGSIYVFPSGVNRENSNCASNGYLNNPYVMTIGSAASDGKASSYSERCSAVFATAYSPDKYTDTEDIPTIKTDGTCTDFPFTKPAAPAMVSGILALVLQYNPSLTYRDMMHLITLTAEVAPLADNEHSWHRNGRGFWVSSDFGFGLLNADNMIKLAKDWKSIPEKIFCTIKWKPEQPLFFDHTENKIITIDVTECKEEQKNVVYLEHVELSTTIDYTLRGAVYMNLTSPASTNTEILEPRLKDYNRDNIKEWNIMSVQNWGEHPRGQWKVTLMACTIVGEQNPHGYVHELTLKFHGTEERPDHYDKGRRYAAFRLPNGNTNRYV